IDFIIDSADMIARSFPHAAIHIIGPGPDGNYFKKKARTKNANIIFHGYVDDAELDAIVSKCHIGLAPYVPDPSHVSYYGDPGKIKKYLSHGLPVIATDIHEFTRQLEKYEAGILISYGNQKQLVSAIKNLMRNYHEYQKNAVALRDRYNYRVIYKKMFMV
ncbi:MAG: glycosyltransferase, partial [Candidatus Roizmanbacteria bacterium]|nr:glycosyltransferase [Candidatus Roizmanbacteria bacterium]